MYANSTLQNPWEHFLAGGSETAALSGLSDVKSFQLGISELAAQSEIDGKASSMSKRPSLTSFRLGIL